MSSTADTDALRRVWLRVCARTGASAASGRRLTTVLRRDMRVRRLAGAGRMVVVYETAGAGRRQCLADSVWLLELEARAVCQVPLKPGLGWECLVLAGVVRAGAEALAQWDYHREPAGAPRISLSAPDGARVLVRESRRLGACAGPYTQRAARSAWEPSAKGIWRRRLGAAGAIHSSLQWLAPGSEITSPSRPDDEACLVLEGELFVEDRLLQAGDFQLAPAGTPPRAITSNSGALLYRHGDTESTP